MAGLTDDWDETHILHPSLLESVPFEYGILKSFHFAVDTLKGGYSSGLATPTSHSLLTGWQPVLRLWLSCASQRILSARASTRLPLPRRPSGPQNHTATLSGLESCIDHSQLLAPELSSTTPDHRFVFSVLSVMLSRGKRPREELHPYERSVAPHTPQDRADDEESICGGCKAIDRSSLPTLAADGSLKRFPNVEWMQHLRNSVIRPACSAVFPQ